MCDTTASQRLHGLADWQRLIIFDGRVRLHLHARTRGKPQAIALLRKAGLNISDDDSVSDVLGVDAYPSLREPAAEYGLARFEGLDEIAILAAALSRKTH